MKTEYLLRLRNLAEKATQGEYYYTEDDSKNTVDGFCYGVVSSEEENDSHSYICHGASVENGNYISSISPSVLIPMLDELIESRKYIEKQVDRYFDIPHEWRLGSPNMKEESNSLEARNSMGVIMNQCNCMELREMVDQFQDKLYHASREASGIKYELGHEIEELKKDKDRLDWLLKHDATVIVGNSREVIDAAMKE